MNIETMKPLGNRIIIKLDKNEDIRLSGIFVPNQEQRKSDIGVIVKMSTEVVTDLSVGDRVIFKKWEADDIHDNKDYILIDIDNIIATVC